MAKTADNGHSVVDDSEFTSEVRQLLHQALDKSELYPTNFEHYIGRPKLLADIRRHFDRTKRNSLVFVEGLTGFRRTFFLQKQVRTVWYDLDVGLDAQAQEIRLVRDLHKALGINGSDFKPGPDPIYRFIILESSAPTSPRLKITEQMLLKILTYHYVSPYFLDLVSHICYEPGITGVPFSSFRCLTTFSQSSTTNRFPDPALGRSGLNYQLVLELRTVFDPKILEKSDDSVTETTSGNDEPELWPITQYAVYHQFDISTGKCLWIMTSASNDALAQIRGPEDIKAALGIQGQAVPLTTVPTTVDCFRSSLSVWTWLGDWSLSDYDHYITTLDERLQELELDHINKKSERPIDEITLKTINTYMEALEKCIVALKSNLRVFQSLLQLYGKDLVKEPYLETCSFMQAGSGTRTVVLQHIEKFKVELKLICDTTEEMIGRADILKEMGTRRENTTHRVLQNRDTATMKELAKLTYIFSTITLLLLPMSVVSTIFSTDIVRFQIPEGDMGGYGGNWSAPAAVWWAAATIIVTSLVGWVGESWRRKSAIAARSSKVVNNAPATTIAFNNFPRIALAKLRRTFHDTVDQSRLWVRRYEVMIQNRVATKFRKKDNDNPDMGQRDQNVYYDMQLSSGMGFSKAEPRTPTIPPSAGGIGVIEQNVRHGDEITDVSRGAGEVASGSGSFDKGSLMEQGAVVGVAKVASDEGK